MAMTDATSSETKAVTDVTSSETKLPTAKVKRHGRLSWVWLIPLVAAGLVVYLAYTTYAGRGPLVTLTLETASGLQVEQTQVKHKAVPLGTVEDISLANDMSHVVVHLRMNSAAESILTDHARFWVVRPRLSAGSFTGLETLVSGAFIEVDPGSPGGKKELEFKGLAEPPGRQSDEPGHVYVLKATRLGSLSAGAPVYNRDVEVGELLSYDLGAEPGKVTLRVFVREPFDRLVRAQTRFWNASGLSVGMGAAGVHVELESIQALLSGAIAFSTPAENEHGPPAEDDATFELYGDRERADDAAYLENLPYVTYFDSSVQGLTRGSPVLLFGVRVGSVREVRLAYDNAKHRMAGRVAFDLQPERLDLRNEHDDDATPQALRDVLADASLRAQLESSSFLTGAKDISILCSPGNRRLPLSREGNAVVIPGQGGDLEGLTASLSDVAAKVDRIPFQQLGENANATLRSFQHLATQIDTNATPALQRLPAILGQMSTALQNANGALGAGGYGQDSEFEHGMERVMSQVGDAARSFRVLADYLDRHPEALIRGRASNTGEK